MPLPFSAAEEYLLEIKQTKKMDGLIDVCFKILIALIIHTSPGLMDTNSHLAMIFMGYH
jgi:hypothetical protein